MTHANWFKLAVLTLFSIVLAYCVDPKKNEVKPDNNDTQSTNRASVLKNYADEIVIPGYANFKVKLDSMVSKSNQFTKAPDTITLRNLRSSWVEAYVEWQKVELFAFGPADENATRSFFNIYPANEATINANIASGSANLEVTSSFTAQGFPALDYLINGIAQSDDSIVYLYSKDKDALLRKNYLNKLNDQMLLKLNQVIGGWSTYRETFVASTGVTASSSISLLVNGYVQNYERFLRSGKFGIPAGAITSVTAPEKVEAYYKKDISKLLAKAAHQASVDFFNGKSVKNGVEGPSLKTYLDGLGAKDSKTGNNLSTTINAQFNTNLGLINLLGDDFCQNVKTNNQQMLDAYNGLQSVVRMLKVDMTSAMSITITYTDNDGD